MWKCAPCSTERQWGSITLAYARQVVKDTGHLLVETPVLYCETCKDNTQHEFSRDTWFGPIEVEAAPTLRDVL